MEEAREAEDQIAAQLTNRLKNFGLTTTESRVYLHLSKMGEGTAGELAKQLEIQRTEIYAILRALQNKGVVVCTIKRPARFVAVPLDRALSLLIDSQKMRLKSMEINKDDLITAWKSIKVSVPKEGISRFQMLTGSDQILARIKGALSSPPKPKMLCSSGELLSKMYYAGVFDVPQAKRPHPDGLLVLTEVTPKNRETASSLRGVHLRHTQVRHPPKFMINGESDVIFVLDDTEGQNGRLSSAMWSSHRPLVRSMRALFMKIWEDGIELDELPPKGSREMPSAEVPLKETSRLTSLRRSVGELLKEGGYKVSEKREFTGISGLSHVFDLYAEIGVGLPLVIDISDREIMEIEVLRMYVKLRDLGGLGARAMLIARGKASVKAKDLALVYGIKLVEL